ncbi:MAG: biotin--[acetyl-CoA-carboxylase] ligase [Burkholderiaceae bacterium]
MNASLTPDRIDALNAQQIEHALRVAWRGECLIEAVEVTGSTNDDLALRAREFQFAQCILRAADFQLGGRGRQRKIWRAAPGDALLFSIAVPVDAAVNTLPAVTLACGVAVADCLAAHQVAVQLKWPNDVRVGGRKLAGILSELVHDHDARSTLVVGIGVNWRLDDAARHEIGQPAVALSELSSSAANREIWIGRLGAAVLAACDMFLRDGFEPFRARFNELLEARGECVDVIEAGERTSSGRVVEVDPLGRLVLESDGALHAISAGEVSLRAKQ